MADVASALYSWSTNEASNAPAGSTTVGTGWDDNLRMMQKVTRGALAHKGADIASAGTTDIGAIEGLFHDITGTTTITGLGTVSAGIWKVLKFEGALTLTHNASSLIIPGGANITTADGDMCMVTSEGSGNWRVNWYVRANGGPVTLAGAAINALSAETSPATDDLLALHDTSAGTTDKITLSDTLKVVNSLTEDASPDVAADFVLSYDTSASAPKKVKPNSILSQSIAAQSDQETGTSTTTIVTPGRQHFHPSAAKAWGVFDAPTTLRTAYPSAGVSCVNSSTGVFVVTHGRTFSSVDYQVSITVIDTGVLWGILTARTATTFTVKFYAPNYAGSTSDLTNPSGFSYECFGDL